VTRAKLFSPLRIGGVELANRIVIAPMCQYSAEDGCMNDWHLIHLGHLALSGAALLTIEATAVTPEGRITYGDVGLYSDACERAMRQVLDSVRRWSDMPIAIQLSHAGRKASTEVPWKGGHQIAPDHAHSWQTVAPSAISFEAGQNAPMALDRHELANIRDAFVEATRRAARLGLDAVQLHGAHGYLLHQFLSPLANQREDEYGGSLENRMRFPLEVFDAVRAVLPLSVLSRSGSRARTGRRAAGPLRRQLPSPRRWKHADVARSTSRAAGSPQRSRSRSGRATRSHSRGR
jgi:2,4-dienoyl-CoA reductase-like NADH-dependent reductase (Old Yellow Enzyme family)